MRGIANVHQVEAIRWGCFSKHRSVSCNEYRLQVHWLPFAATHTGERPGNIAHHSQEKGVGRNVDDHKWSIAANQCVVDATKRCRGLTGRSAKGREIMFAEQALYRCVHRSVIESRRPRDPMSGERLGFTFLEHV